MTMHMKSKKQRLFMFFLFIYLTLIINLNSASFNESEYVLEYINSYVIAECEVMRTERERSLDLLETEKDNLQQEPFTEVRLKTPNITFNLLLYKDEFIENIYVEVYTPLKNMSKSHDVHSIFYEGVLKDEPLKSSVMGYLHKNIFLGTIIYRNTLYFVQPVDHLFPTAAISESVVIYRNEDVNFSQWNASAKVSLNISDWHLSYRIANLTLNNTEPLEGIDFDYNNTDLFCEIELVADHTLYNFFKNDIDQISAYLYLHAKHADKIFRKTDFNMDDKPDGIRISVAKISVYTTKYESNYPMAEASNIGDFLMKLVQRQQQPNFCLSICMTHRLFPGPVVGEAFKPDTRFPHLLGGICQKPVALQQQPTKTHNVSFNVAAINLLRGKSNLIPFAVSLMAFTHEIGHGFGSEHDVVTNPLCSPSKPFGKFLMHAKTLPPSEQLLQFSMCSRVAMGEIIRRKGGCLKTKNAVCGNGIREGAEQCDCGRKTICSLVDPCCNPPDDLIPERGCTLKEQDGTACSPKESDCCTEDCKVNTAKNIFCYNDPSLCLFSTCNGISPDCPSPNGGRPGYSCELESSMLCSGGKCNNSICNMKYLEECLCSGNKTTECLICCADEESCVPASEIGLLKPGGKKFAHMEGTRCNDGTFHCDDSGNCIDPKEGHYTFLFIFLGITAFFLLATISIGLAICLIRQSKKFQTLIIPPGNSDGENE